EVVEVQPGRRQLRQRPRVGYAEGQEDVPGVVTAGRAGQADAKPGTLRQALELVWQQWRVGGENDDDRATLALQPVRQFVIQTLPNRHAANLEPGTLAVVGLHQGAEGVGLAVDLDQ